MIALILAGGSGTRFWPLSNERLPKQYLTLFENKSMLKLTYERLAYFIPKEHIYVVTTHEQVPLVYDYLPEMSSCQIIPEPCAMNTCACIAYSIANFLWNYPRNEKVLIVPADHYIPDKESFKNAVLQSEICNDNDYLMLFGIKPTYAATGYGYVEIGDNIQNSLFHVKQFKEKPHKELADEYFNSKKFYWNSGIFCFSLFSIINSFDTYNKELFERTIEISCIKNHKEKKEEYSKLEKLSIDVSIFEKANNIIINIVDFEWSDVGNWSSLSELMERDNNNNYFQGKNYALNSFGNSVFSKKEVALLGVDDLIIVETDNEILVCKKEFSEYVKYIKK